MICPSSSTVCNVGDIDRARDYLTQALAIYEAIKSPAAERVRGRLAQLAQ